MNLALTQGEWSNDTTPFYHAAFLFPNSQTSISLNNQASQNYWLRITAQTSDAAPKKITLLNGPVTVRDGPVSIEAATAGGQFRLYSVSGAVVPQLLDTTTGLWHTLQIYNDNGVLTLQLSD